MRDRTCDAHLASSSVAREGARPASARIAAHRSYAQPCLGAIALIYAGADQRLPCTLMNRVDIKQSLGRIDRRAGLVLRGQHGVATDRACRVKR